MKRFLSRLSAYSLYIVNRFFLQPRVALGFLATLRILMNICVLGVAGGILRLTDIDEAGRLGPFYISMDVRRPPEGGLRVPKRECGWIHKISGHCCQTAAVGVG